MAAVLATRFPEKTPELFAYQATIVWAERNYERKHWVSYNHQFQREALARKDLNCSITDPRLYNKAFTGRARAITRCPFCLQDDHTVLYCLKTLNASSSGGSQTHISMAASLTMETSTISSCTISPTGFLGAGDLPLL